MHAAFTPQQVLRGYKEKAESLVVHGGKLFLGSAQGNLTIYRLNEGPDVPLDERANLLDTRKAFSRRAIEKLAVIKEANLLVALSDGHVSLYDLADLSAVTALPQTKGALDFALDSSIQRKEVGPRSPTSAASAAYRPSAGSLTLPRSRSANPGAYASASLRGMEALVLEKEAREKEMLSELDAEGALLNVEKAGQSSEGVMSLVTVLAELTLSHSPRSITFPEPTRIFMSYSATDFATLDLPLASSSSCAAVHERGSLAISRSTSVPQSSSTGEFVDVSKWPAAAEFSIPLSTADADAVDRKDSDATSLSAGAGSIGIPTSTSTSAGFGAAFSGLGGYIGIGRGSNKTTVHAVEGGDVLVVRGTSSILVNRGGKPSRKESISWPVAPDEVTFAAPYVFAILPNCGSLATHFKDGTSSLAQQPVVQIRSAGTLAPVQTIPFPPHTSSTATDVSFSHPPTVQLLTPITSMKPPLYLVVSPSDRERGATALDKLGATVYRLDMQSWAAQIDELVERQYFGEALALLDSVDEVILPEKLKLRAHVQSLHGLSLYANAEYDKAIETFIELDTNPAKVLALFPDYISGPLARPRDQWLRVFGGKENSGVLPPPRSERDLGEGSPAKLKPGGESLADSDRRSLKSMRSARDLRAAHASNEERNFDALGRFLADRRRIFKPILETNQASHALSASTWRDESDKLFELPDGPLASLPLDRLSALAQAVDTALFKTFLSTKPALVGPLCRVENWCEVEQVEELLKQRNKNSELIALYSGKSMHEKALALLKKLSEKEDDLEDKLGPSIRYLQNLEPSFIDVILQTSHWILDESREMGMEIFTADTGKVGLLPRFRVVEDLALYDRDMCIVYLEHIIGTLNDGDPALHEQLASLYLARAADLGNLGANEERTKVVDKLSRFLELSEQYRPERILNQLPENDLFEPRAILLGRMGQHEAALGLYVYRLRAHDKAELYCQSVYSAQRRPGDDQVFLTLLRIYLRPKEGVVGADYPAGQDATAVNAASSMLQPALSLIGRHGSRLDAEQVIDLLPPLVTMQSILPFAQRTLQHATACRNSLRIEAQVRKERSLQADERITALKSRKFRVSQNSMCPRCNRRLGNSVVVLAEGSLMHYSCRTER
ncbi:Vacuolar morphogenesis protein 6 [Tilletia horrida]|nr:Vacuolar morphogenesis protein 6 [Tilletia horrida]